MTLGRVQRDLVILEGRVKIMEAADPKANNKTNGATFSDKQVAWIDARIEDKAKVHEDRALLRLIVWCVLAAAGGGASVVLAYLKFRG